MMELENYIYSIITSYSEELKQFFIFSKTLELTQDGDWRTEIKQISEEAEESHRQEKF